MNKALRNPLIYIVFVLPAFLLFLAFSYTRSLLRLTTALRAGTASPKM